MAKIIKDLQDGKGVATPPSPETIKALRQVEYALTQIGISQFLDAKSGKQSIDDASKTLGSLTAGLSVILALIEGEDATEGILANKKNKDRTIKRGYPWLVGQTPESEALVEEVEKHLKGK